MPQNGTLPKLEHCPTDKVTVTVVMNEPICVLPSSQIKCDNGSFGFWCEQSNCACLDRPLSAYLW